MRGSAGAVTARATAAGSVREPIRGAPATGAPHGDGLALRVALTPQRGAIIRRTELDPRREHAKQPPGEPIPAAHRQGFLAARSLVEQQLASATPASPAPDAVKANQ